MEKHLRQILLQQIIFHVPHVLEIIHSQLALRCHVHQCHVHLHNVHFVQENVLHQVQHVQVWPAHVQVLFVQVLQHVHLQVQVHVHQDQLVHQVQQVQLVQADLHIAQEAERLHLVAQVAPVDLHHQHLEIRVAVVVINAAVLLAHSVRMAAEVRALVNQRRLCVKSSTIWRHHL